MSGGFTKLFSSIVTSSIWIEDDATVRVWIAMLASADADGIVEGSVPGFANLARVTTEQMRAAAAKLSSPDPDSRTPDHEGRRIETIEGGWRILNYRAYRERGQAKEGSRAPYYRAYRQRKRDDAQHQAQPATVARHTEAEAEARSTPTPSGLSEDGSREAERSASRCEAPAAGSAPRRERPQSESGSALRREPLSEFHVDQAIADRAGIFVERYSRVYAKARHGAFYRGKPARDHAYACDLVKAWPDLEYLEAMAELFLLKAEWKTKNEPGTIGQFQHMASQCDALLKQHGWRRQAS